MPRPYPAEFRRDVVAVSRKYEVALAQIAKDFGISEVTLHNWLKKADIEDGVSPRRHREGNRRVAGGKEADPSS